MLGIQSASGMISFWILYSLKSVKEQSNIVNLFRNPDSHEEKDVWIFIWGHHAYSVSKFYHHHFESIRPPITMLWIWKSKCIPRKKFFSWLLLNDRLNTRNILRRRKKYLENTELCYEPMQYWRNTWAPILWVPLRCCTVVLPWHSMEWRISNASQDHSGQQYFPFPFFHGNLHVVCMVIMEWKKCNHIKWKDA